jgi:hypothetical protein
MYIMKISVSQKYDASYTTIKPKSNKSIQVSSERIYCSDKLFGFWEWSETATFFPFLAAIIETIIDSTHPMQLGIHIGIIQKLVSIHLLFKNFQ